MPIIAIDPGPHTGVAIRLDNGTLETMMIYLKTHELWKYIMSARPNAIIVERFRTAGRISAPGLDTVEIQVSLQSLAWMMGTDFYWQTPADRKPFELEARKLIGANKTKLQSHAVDAVAHLLRFEYMVANAQGRTPNITRGGIRA